MASAQAVEALYSHGDQLQMDFTPVAAVAAGTVLSHGTGLNRLVSIADVALEAGVLGAVSTWGVYKLKLVASTSFALGQTVEWDISAGLATDVASGDGDFGAGVCFGAAAADDDFVLTAINFPLVSAEGSSG